MGNHINSEGQFQSDKYPYLRPDKLVLSFKEKEARAALAIYARMIEDKDLARDIMTRLSDFRGQN